MNNCVIISLIDYIFPTPEGGDGIASLKEAEDLSEENCDVFVLSKKKGEEADHILKIINGQYVKSDLPDRADIIICNQPSNIIHAIHLSKTYKAKLITRKHLCYETLHSLSVQFNVDTLITRLPVEEILYLYNLTLDKSDLIVDVDSSPIKPLRVEKTVYVPPPVDINSSHSSPVKNSSVHTNILIGGRLDDPIKGLERILNIINSLVKDKIPINLHVIGNLPQKENIYLSDLLGEQYIHHGWIGSRSEYEKLLQSIDIFLTLPHYEPYGLMAVENIQNGVFVISSDHGIAKQFYAKNNLSNGEIYPIIEEQNKKEFANYCANVMKYYITKPEKRTMLVRQANEALHSHYENTPNLKHHMLNILIE